MTIGRWITAHRHTHSSSNAEQTTGLWRRNDLVGLVEATLFAADLGEVVVGAVEALGLSRVINDAVGEVGGALGVETDGVLRCDTREHVVSVQ